MRKFDHPGHTAYELFKKVVIIKKKKDKIRFYARGHGFINWKFHRNKYGFTLIRTPVFYLSKTNGEM